MSPKPNWLHGVRPFASPLAALASGGNVYEEGSTGTDRGAAHDDGALLFYGLGGELRENCEPHSAERFHHGSPIRSRWRLYGSIRHRVSKHAGVLPRSSNADTHLR